MHFEATNRVRLHYQTFSATNTPPNHSQHKISAWLDHTAWAIMTALIAVTPLPCLPRMFWEELPHENEITIQWTTCISDGTLRTEFHQKTKKKSPVPPKNTLSTSSNSYVSQQFCNAKFWLQLSHVIPAKVSFTPPQNLACWKMCPSIFSKLSASHWYIAKGGRRLSYVIQAKVSFTHTQNLACWKNCPSILSHIVCFALVHRQRREEAQLCYPG